MFLPLLAVAALVAGGLYYRKTHPAGLKVITALETGKAYAINVITNTTVDATFIDGAILAIDGGMQFGTMGKPAAFVRMVTTFPGLDLSQNFGGQANQWIAYVIAKKPIALPEQPAPTLILTSAFEADAKVPPGLVQPGPAPVFKGFIPRKS